MSDDTAAPPTPSPVPLRPSPGADGTICLDRHDALRVALALNHLAAITHWTPGTGPGDHIIADDAAWMAESIGDAVTSSANRRRPAAEST